MPWIPSVPSTSIFRATVPTSYFRWFPDCMNLSVLLGWHLGPILSLTKRLNVTVSSTQSASSLALPVCEIPFPLIASAITIIFIYSRVLSIDIRYLDHVPWPSLFPFPKHTSLLLFSILCNPLHASDTPALLGVNCFKKNKMY